MSILHLAAAAMSGASTDPISASWFDINVSYPAGSGQNLAATILFTNSSPRTLQIDFDNVPTGSISYVKNGSAPVTLADNDTFTVVSGDTLYFVFISTTEETITVTVTDNTRGSVVDSFLCYYTGEYGGGGPPP